ncbi:MAG: AAA family ATPase [Actinobacteria bacterium]|nr:AAA family ATPase [Actinomycetota bacterium]
MTTVAAQLGGSLIDGRAFDVGAAREQARRRRLTVLAAMLSLPLAFLWYRIAIGAPFNVFALPSLPQDPFLILLPVFLIVVIGIMVAMPLAAGRSPHVRVRPEEIDVTLDDVQGLDGVVDEVVQTLNTFLAYQRYRDRLGGTPRRGLLFEGPPGTGKTHLAKAMAHHAGVPFHFVSATSFQSMWYGATARKIRSYFRALRKAARQEGGAIGFIEEIDAIATTRGGLSHSTGLRTSHFGSSEGTGGVVNELLVQLQSFDTPAAGVRVWNWTVDLLNSYLPVDRQLRRRAAPYHNLLIIAATNRADSLDPALLRPGRFDRRLTFDVPAKDARRDLIDYLLARKAHDAELDRDELRDQLAQQTFGATPITLERLLDEALIVALRDGRDGMAWSDVQTARLRTELGLTNPVAYTAHERLVVATHEAGHAVVAHLAGTRRLEVLSIIKRGTSLGLLAHGDLDEVYTRSRSELLALIEIALGGHCVEQLVFGEPSTGAASDLAAATRMAAEIVGAHGMGDSLVSLAAVEQSTLGGTNLVGRVLSDRRGRDELDQLLADASARVSARLADNLHLVTALRDALLARDELVGEEISEVLAAAGGGRREIDLRDPTPDQAAD